ncbi:MAG: dTDP-4-dehydrorhamnose 3,5-epimerase [Verrucomicrobia bacterium]|nr:dTDP-4-dehydrorhamnose 3,5-epimerase [Verrucomicrobiota bacterium]
MPTASELPLAGLQLIEPCVFGDARGFFFESWNRRSYREAGLEAEFVQDNFSRSRRGTLRGLHFQNPAAQGKLVCVLVGSVYDVVVDLRRSSPTFGRWHGLELSESNHLQLYVPPGFAHGFVVTSDSAIFHYKCTAFYEPAAERALRWDDPDLAIPWPVSQPILSGKDTRAPRLCELPHEHLFA